MALADRAPGPLAGVRVLDFSRILAGPFCTAMLADLGADVIKVEPPGGDEYRRIGPRRGDQSAYFALVNRAKRSVVLDLKGERGRACARALARRCDVVVENFAPGVAARLGVDHATLSRDNAGLVYLSVSGFGQSGPLAARPAYDAIAQAMSGIMTTTGAPEGPPTLIGESLGDLAAALYAAFGVMVALFERERSGRGRRLEVSMLDALITLQPTALVQHLYAGCTPARVGNRHPLSTPFGEFEAGDGHLVIAVLNDGQFRRLTEVIGQPGLASDPRYASDAARTRHEPQLRDAIERWSRRQRVEEALVALAAARVPAAPVWTLPEALASEHARARGLVETTRHPLAGELPVVRQPVRFEGATMPPPRPAPGLGEHGEAILAEAGLSAGHEDGDA